MAEPAKEFDPANVAARLERLPPSRYQTRLLLIIATAWFFDSIDLGALTFLLGPIKSEFHLSLSEAGLLSSASFAGMFLGAATAGMLADRFGRAKVFQVSMLVWGCGSLLCALSPSASALAASRIVVGIGMGMEFPVAQAIASEFTPASRRGLYIALLEGCWPLGFIAAGLLTYFVLPTWGWRAVFIATGLPAIFVYVVRRGVPESPRWLQSRGLGKQAEEVLTQVESRVRSCIGAELPPVPVLDLPEAILPRAIPIAELWSRTYAKRTIMAWSTWFLALLGYYGLTTWLTALLQAQGFAVTKSVLYIVTISLAGIPGFLTSAYLLEAWGRKPTAVFMFLGSAVACYFYGTSSSFVQLITFGSAMQFFLFGMWSVLYAYTPELYPTRARATGAGAASAVGRLGSLAGPPLVAALLARWGNSAVFSAGAAAFAAAAVIVFFLGVETRGRIVEEIAP